MSWGRPVGGASLPRTTDAHEAEAASLGAKACSRTLHFTAKRGRGRALGVGLAEALRGQGGARATVARGAVQSDELTAQRSLRRSAVERYIYIYPVLRVSLAGAALGPVWAYCDAAGAAREPGLGSIGSPAPEPQLSWEWEFVSGDSKGFLRYNAGACVRVRVRVCVCVCVRV
jgi:hypothetical protein